MGLNLHLFIFLIIVYEIGVADPAFGKGKIQDPRSGMGKIRIRGKDPGSATLVFPTSSSMSRYILSENQLKRLSYFIPLPFYMHKKLGKYEQLSVKINH